MTGAFRIPGGGRIDRTEPLVFSFDGVTMTGLKGDTLASALLANGIHLVGRSFKYHRPRGVLTAGSDEPNALVTVKRDRGRTTPNLRATEVELYDGLKAESQNRWPSLKRDAAVLNDAFSPMFSAGFYYKTFMGPHFVGSNRAWTKVYEPAIRRMAGLGKAPAVADPDHYASRFAHCDVLVVGAGPAGLAAARSAAGSGARVILADEQAEPGGSLLAETVATIDGQSASTWISSLRAGLDRLDQVTVLSRTQAFGYFHDTFIALAERVTDHLGSPDGELPRERLWQVFAREVVIAVGAHERPLVFPDNDRPGILLAGAAHTYLARYGVRLGRRAVLVGSDDTIYRTALALAAEGVDIEGVLDTRPEAAGAWQDRAIAARLPVTRGATVLGTDGRHRVQRVTVGEVGAGGVIRPLGALACDHLLMCGGWTPSMHLVSQSRGKLRYDAERLAFLPGSSAGNLHVAGAVAGHRALQAVIESGYEAGERAAAACGFTPGRRPSVSVAHTRPMAGGSLGALPQPGDEIVQKKVRPAKAFVDFQNDVTAKDIKLATQEGFRSIEHIKRYTTTGMATDQGKTSNMNALAIAAGHLGRPLPDVGLTTFRMPYTPVTFGTLAGHSRGDLFDPVRRTPIDGWAAAEGAVFEDVGLWKRARYFPRGGDSMHLAVERECRTVRASAGLFDASTLGKIEVVGPDAAEFLERMYVNSWKGLGPGRCRYGLLLNEAGFIIDDGVIGRMAADRFHVTTTTGGAPRVLHMMEDYLQTEFTDLACWLTSTTEQWAVIAVQGPKARDVIAPLVEGVDLGAAAFPHMSVREGRILDVETRLFRVSFTGELGFEVNVPADHGRAVWEAIHARVAAVGGCAYGTETMHVLRAEKGFIIVGQETDGTVTPDDAGLGWAIGKSKRDFVGKRSLSRPDIAAPGRPQLVGLRIADPAVSELLEEGAQITDIADPPVGTRALGHVTSSYWSPAVGLPIALALVADGRNRMGQRLHVPMPGKSIPVDVVSPVFYDPKGERLNG